MLGVLVLPEGNVAVVGEFGARRPVLFHISADRVKSTLRESVTAALTGTENAIV